MPSFDEQNADVSSEIKCKECGANLKFQPGTKHLTCEYCGAFNEIVVSNEPIEETDYLQFISELEANSDKHELSTVRCENCGASTTLSPNVVSDICPYCSTPLIIKNGTTSKTVRPKYLLPFTIDRIKANKLFIQWVKSLWFAPSELKRFATEENLRLKGLYMPYWTYDTNTDSDYVGAKGVYYYVTQTYTVTVNGKSQIRTRQVRRTRWSPASGQVQNTFDDILIFASISLPSTMVDELQPWNLHALVDYNDQFLAGFVAEAYKIGVKDGFEFAKQKIAPVIQQTIKSHIGGDEQRIYNIKSHYNNIKFKHILLPLWISAYHYNNKIFRFIVNAQTGEIKGERPYSAWKITFFILSILALIAVIIYIIGSVQ